MTRSRAAKTTALVLAATLLGVLSGCSAGPGSSNGGGNAAGTTKVTTGVPTNEKITLVEWDPYGPPAVEGKAIDRLNKMFEQQHPNVTIKRVGKAFNDYYVGLKLGLAGSHAPDIAVGNQGWTGDYAYVQDHLIRSLQPYVKAYGWDKRWPNLFEFRWSPDGKNWGTGDVYGVPQYAADKGLYYNKKKLQQLGLQPPKTLADFEHALKVAKAAGEIPIQFGTADKFPAAHEFQMLQGDFVSAPDIRKFIFGSPSPGTFDTPADVKTATMLQNWAKAGYFAPGFNGTGYDDSTANFAKGQGVFMYTGTWMTGTFQDQMGKDVGFMHFPPANAGAPVAIGATNGEGWHITTASKHPDVAAAYLDFITGPTAAKEMARVGDLPAMAVPASQLPNSGALFKETVNAYAQTLAKNAAVPDLGWTTPNFTDEFGGLFQELMAGRLTPKQFTGKVQAIYDKFYKGR